MSRQNEQFSLSRFINLLKYDFNTNRLLYILLVPVIMIIIGVLFWSIFPSYTETIKGQNFQPSWNKDSYYPFLISGYIIFGTFIVGKSFPYFKNKQTLTTYLTLPASTLEKFLLQWVLRIIGFLVIYPIIFQLTTNLTVDLYLMVQKAKLSSIGLPMEKLPTIHKASLLSFLETSEKSYLILIVTLTISFLGVSLLFYLSTIYKQWNIIFGPLTVMALIFFIILYMMSLSNIVVADQVKFWDFKLELNYPTVFDDLPLILVSTLVIAVAASIACWIAAYFRLKEKEV